MRLFHSAKAACESGFKKEVSERTLFRLASIGNTTAIEQTLSEASDPSAVKSCPLKQKETPWTHRPSSRHSKPNGTVWIRQLRLLSAVQIQLHPVDQIAGDGTSQQRPGEGLALP